MRRPGIQGLEELDAEDSRRRAHRRNVCGMRTIVLLDVDGTVIPTRHPWTTAAQLRGIKEFDLVVPPYAPTTVRVRPAVIEAINSWHAPGAEIVWLTSWGWRAQWLARAIGLPELEVFYDPSPGTLP